jgi:SAM-dependent methyltransferase
VAVKELSTVPTSTTERYIFNGSVSARAVFNRRTAGADAAHLIPHLRAGQRVADLGCGAGSITLGLAAAVAPGVVLGFDVSEAAIADARAHALAFGSSNVEFEVANIYALDLPDNSFDVVHFSGVLAHLFEPERALQLAYRALKPGGVLAAREPQKEGDWFAGPHCEAIRAFNGLLIDDWKAAGGDPFFGRHLGVLLREAGFERLEIAPSCAPALSHPSAWASAAERLGDPEFAARVVGRGSLTADQIAHLATAISAWSTSPEAVVAAAECTALAWKPQAAQANQ